MWGPLAEDQDNNATYITKPDTPIVTFHGMYQSFQGLFPLDQLIDTVNPLFEQFNEEPQNGETLIDFVSHVGIENLKEVTV